MGDEEGRFLLSGEDQAFKEKASSLFSALSGVQYSPTEDVDGFLKSDPLKDGSQPPGRDCRGVGQAEDRSRDVAGSRRLPRDGGSQLMPPPNRPVWKRKRGNNVPDHFANPSKYTKYSLDDVPEQQMSQKSNTAAALSFLREIDEKKRQEEAKEEEEAAADKRPLFKKPKNKTKPNTSEDTSSSTNVPDSEPTHTDSHQTTPKSKQKKKASKGKEIKLSHLEEYEDDG